MRANVMPEALRAELGRCTKVAVKGSKNIDSCIELTAGNACLGLRVQDAHLCLVSSVAAEVKSDGAVLVDCDRLSAVLGVRPDGTPLQLWDEGAFLHVKQGEFRVKLPLLRHSTMAQADFNGPFDLDMSMSAKVLHGMLRCKRSVEDDQAMFVGLLLDFSEAHLLRVAAFTRALLQIAHFDLVAAYPAFRVALAPRCIPILESMPATDFRLAFSVQQAKVFIFSKTFAVRIACAEDRFPAQYQSVLGLYRWREGVYPVPLMSNTGNIVSEVMRSKLVFNRADVLAALESAAVVLGKDEQIIEMKIGQRLDDGKIVVEFIGRNLTSKSHATEKVLATGDVASAISLGLNYGSVREVLRYLDAEELVLHVGRKEDAIVFTEKGYEHIVAIATLMRL